MKIDINSWPLARKMLAAFGVAGVLFLALAIDAVKTNRSLADAARRQVSEGLAGEIQLSDALNQVREQRIIVYYFYNAIDLKEEAKLEERLIKSRAELEAAVDVFAAGSGTGFPAETAALRNAVADLATVNNRIVASRKLSHSADPATLKLIKTDGKKASHAAIKAADTLKDLGRARSQEISAEGDAVAAFALIVTAALTLLSLGVLGLVWWLVGRTVARPMAELATATTTLAHGGAVAVPHTARGDELGAIARAVESFRAAAQGRAEEEARIAAEQQAVTAALGEGLNALSAGDLTAEISQAFPPAYGALRTSFNTAVGELRALVGSVLASANHIRTGSEDIAHASEDLARRTENSASSLEQTSNSIRAMEQRLHGTAEAAGRTVVRADQAIATVGEGRAVASEAVQAMGRVSESAKGIDDVIEGLDKIAFQTRVLAMNAAVEAGRAGEAGRGFAVVADLVSALAMRAEEEAKLARDQLSVTQAEIGTAVDAVQKVDSALGAISEDVGEVHALLGGMADDNRAQSAAVVQISSAIGGLDQATQQNAAMVEQTSAAARSLNGEVGEMARQAARFRVGDPVRDHHAAPAALPPSLRPEGRQPSAPAVPQSSDVFAMF